MAESLCCSPETVTTLASLVAQTVKNLPAVQKTRARSLGREDPLEEEMATHSSVLAWRIPWMGYTQSTRLQRVGRNRATNAHTTTLLISYNPVQNKKLKVWGVGGEGELVVFLSYCKWLFNFKSRWRNRHFILNYWAPHLFSSIPKLLSPSKEETLLRLVNMSWESTSPPLNLLPKETKSLLFKSKDTRKIKLEWGLVGSKRASLVAQMVKNLPAMCETWVRFLGWKDPLEEAMANPW